MMKHKTFSFLLTMLMSMVACVASAHNFVVNGIYYNITSSTESTVSVTFRGDYYSSYSYEYTGSVVIPKTVTYSGKTYSVTSIGESAFQGCSGLTSVTIPNSVASIGDNAFYDCSGLTSVTIPSSVTSIGSSAFEGCSGLTSVTIGNCVTEIGNYAFRGCSGLTSVTIPNSVTSIGSSAFEGCSGLTSVTIPNSVTSIGSSAFRGCSGLTSVTIPNSVTSIGDYAFYYCTDLTSVAIYSNTIASNTFGTSRSLVALFGTQVKEYVFGDGVKSIGSYACYNCKNMTSVTIPNSVTSIGDNAFSGCSGLTVVTIPNSVTSIGDYVFSGCSCLISVTIPNSVTSIGKSTFTGTAWYDGQPDGLIYVGNIAYEYKGTMPQGTEIVLKEGTVSITGSAFSGCSGLTSVNIPNSVTSIGESAFRNCRSLTSVTIPNSVTSIGWSAFYGCSGLNSVTIPNSVTSIGVSAFEGCSGLTSVTIPSSVTSIGSSAFEGCSGLTSVTIPNSVTSIGWNAFSGCSGLTSVTIPSSVTSIGSSAFEGCSGLTSVTIGNSVTSIGDNAFYNCSGLTSVTINSNAIASMSYSSSSTLSRIFGEQVKEYVFGDEVGSIGSYACYNCTNITSVTIPNSVTSIGSSAFEGCSGLTSVTIGNSVTSIGDNAFYNCSGLTSVTIGNSVTSIGSYAFRECSGLTSVTINSNAIASMSYSSSSTLSRIFGEQVKEYVFGDEVGSIGSYACYNCTNITSVTIPNSVTEIGEYAFYGTAWYDEQPDGLVYIGNVAYKYKGTMPQGSGIVLKEGTVGIAIQAFRDCSSLTSVTIPNSVTSIGSFAFYGCGGLTSVTINSNTIASKSNESSSTLAGIFGSQVKEYVFGDGVESIGSYACYNCKNMTSVTIPNSVTEIGWNAFSGCSGLTSVTIPNSVTSIGVSAFRKCSGLTSVTIPNSVTSIGSFAFEGCSGLTSVTIGNSVTSIGSSAFRECSGLTSVTINSNAIASMSYSSSSTLSRIFGEQVKEYVFGDGVESIGSYACYNCKNMTSVTIPNSVTSIGYDAFSGCSGLTSVTIPNSVTSIGDNAFYNCSGLTSVTINSNTIASKSYQTSSTLSRIFGEQVKEYVFGDEVGSIGSYACYNCTNITSVTIPSSVTSIGSSAFYGCSGLTSVTIPNSVTTIESSMFKGCSSLTSVTIPNSVTSIGGEAFSGCSSLTSVTIPNSVTSIGDKAFDGCSVLTKAEFASVESLCNIKFGHSSSNPLYYAHHLYINGEDVKDLVIPNSVTSIDRSAFSGCSGLTSVTIPNSVTSIGEGAFGGCSGLTSVTIPSSVTSIGNSAFSGCTDLTSVAIYSNTIASNTFDTSRTLVALFGTQVKEYVFGDGVESIGSYACYNCKNLTSVTIPNSVTSIGSYAFYDCSGLTRAEFASVESLCNIKFSNSTSNPLSYAHKLCIDGKEVTDLVIPNSVTSIGSDAFSGCSGLTSVTIGNSVTWIGEGAFGGCSGLTSVTIPSSVTSIGSSAFGGCSSLTSVTVNSNAIASKAYSSSQTLSGFFGPQVKEYVFGDGIGSIGSYACYNCTNLTSVTIPNSVTSIGSYAFSGCRGLTSFTIPQTVTFIGSYAFSGCRGLTSVTIPENLTTIGSNVFDGCDACSIYVKKGTDILLRLWADGYVPYDITTHERLVTPGVEIQESTVTSMKCNLTNLYEEYAYQLYFDGQPVGTTSFYQTGLEPNHEYTVSLTIAENKAKPFVCNVPNKVKVKTATLELTPQQPKVVSEGNVVVEATSNIQNDAEKVGVEWRRVDWTDDFPSNSATAYLFNGTIQGYIRNLNTNYLWKFRAFYESASGNRYYSGWMGIDPTNTSYFEPTVHTYAEHSIEGNSVQVRGYAQRGSENVTAQGFMYWAASAEVKAHRDGAIAKAQTVPADAVQVEAKGTVMQTILEGLSYNTTYNYVAFMTTSDGETYYGEQQTFTIGEDLTPVESVEVAPKAASIVAIYDASGRKQPRMQHGVNIVRMSDGTVRKIMVK